MFSNDNLLLQLAYAMLIAAVISRLAWQARTFIAASAAALFARAVLFPADYVTPGWMALLLAAWLFRLWADQADYRKVRFSAAEEAMRDAVLSALPPGAARTLIDQGLWLDGGAGEVLIREGEAVDNLYYLVSGQAVVTSGGRQVGMCGPGDLIGEATILSRDSATATVTLGSDARFWCAPTQSLRRILDENETMRIAIERSFAAALKDKLRAANQVIANQAAASL